MSVLAVDMRFSAREWRVLAYTLAAGPVSAYAVGKRVGIGYANVKAIVRELVAWSILERTAAGIVFQPNASLWDRRPTLPSPPSRRQPSKAATDEGDVEVSVEL